MLWDENKAENTKMCNFPDKENRVVYRKVKRRNKICLNIQTRSSLKGGDEDAKAPLCPNHRRDNVIMCTLTD